MSTKGVSASQRGELVGDLVGTKKRLALARVLGSSVQKLFLETFSHTRLGR
jgi:glucokinase